MRESKPTNIGESEGVIVPDAGRERLGLKKEERLFLTEDPTFERQMALAAQIMHDDRDLLRVLAK